MTRREFEKLLTQMDSRDPTVRRKAMHFLGSSRRKKAREAVLEALNDSDVRTRTTAVIKLWKRETKGAIHVLRKLLSDPDADVRWATAFALGRGDRSIRDTVGDDLMAILDDSDRRVRMAACSALGSLGYRKAIPMIKDRINSLDPGMRAAACWAIGEICDKISEKDLLRATKDEDVNVRFEAAGALLRMGNPEGSYVLEDILLKKESPDFIKFKPFSRTVRVMLADYKAKKQDHRQLKAKRK